MRHKTPSIVFRKSHAIVLGIILALPCKLSAQVLINEVMASNATTHADPDFGNFSDWIELYNASGQDVDLSGHFLSDDPGNPVMWEFQSGSILAAKSYIVVYADDIGAGLHSNFKLSAEGEQVLLFDPQGLIIDSLSFPPLTSDISYGRNQAQPEEVGFFATPSPGEANGLELLAGICPPPLASLPGGLYQGPRSIQVDAQGEGFLVHYTLDGSEPTQASPLFPPTLQLDTTTVLRVRSFAPDYLPGPVKTWTYFIDEEQHLPIVSLVTDPDHFFSDSTGIYVEGTAGVPGYCTEVPHNVNQDWERPVNIELYETDGRVALNQAAGASIFGGCSRVRYPIKSLALYARKSYGKGSFDYKIFPDKSNDSYQSFVLRAAADDQPFTLFRDGMAQMLVKDVIDVDVQAYRPAVLYINGQYWGIHNLREKINEHYVADNFGVDPDSVDLLSQNPENPGNVMAGDAEHYLAMIQYLKDHDITMEEHYAHLKSQMDVNEYINYQVIQVFLGGQDWPGNNIKFWRSKTAPNNRWRWILFDLDHLLKTYHLNIMEVATEEDCGCDWPNPPWSTYLFRRLLENPEFRHEFTQRFALYANSHFSRERIHSLIDSMQAVLAPEIPRHIERWGGQKTSLPDNTWVQPIFNSVEEWESHVQLMRDFTDTRHEIALKQLKEALGSADFVSLGLKITPPGTGAVQCAGMDIRDSVPTASIPYGEAISLRAQAEPGYRFSHWEVQSLVAKDSSVIARGDLWKYLVSPSTPDPQWTSLSYDDSHWSEGFAQLGYGEGDAQTVLDYGGDPQNKIITYWFRKTIALEDSSAYQRYMLKLLRDDGARIFVNGLEVIRDNMQRWAVGASATALRTISGEEENQWLSFDLNPALFHTGENVVAVEIHQASKSSSDLSFDLELVARSRRPGPLDSLHQLQLDFMLEEDMEVLAHMIPDTLEIRDLYINEILSSNSTGLLDEAEEYEDWIELYNAGEHAVDLAGLFLADTFPADQAWVFPPGMPEITTIGAREFMVVYADNDINQGPLHANFKLSRAGEEVVLLQKMGSEIRVIDHLMFGSQAANVSFGRIPDGSPVLEFMTIPSPAASNYLDHTGAWETRKPENVLSLYPVPTRGKLYLRFNEQWRLKDAELLISIFSMEGRKVHNSQQRSSALIELDLAEHKPGMYIIRIQSDELVVQKQLILY